MVQPITTFLSTKSLASVFHTLINVIVKQASLKDRSRQLHIPVLDGSRFTYIDIFKFIVYITTTLLSINSGFCMSTCNNRYFITMYSYIYLTTSLVQRIALWALNKEVSGSILSRTNSGKNSFSN